MQNFTFYELYGIPSRTYIFNVHWRLGLSQKNAMQADNRMGEDQFIYIAIKYRVI